MATGSCCKKLGAIVGLLKAISSRILFAVHGLICIWRLFMVKQEPLYWCMVLTLLAIILEMVVTLRIKGGAEWGWFSPSVFLYLAYTVPPIWLLELDLLKRRIEHRHTNGYHLKKDTSNLPFLPGKIPIPLDPEKWVRILQQVLLLLLIIGRWLLPKGNISREQLSQLLLIYMGMAADIIELFEAFKETAVMYSWNLTIVILSLWTASLLQFTFVVSTTKPKQTRTAPTGDGVDANAENRTRTGEHWRRHERNGTTSNRNTTTVSLHRQHKSRCCCCCCCTADVVSILTTITLQDGPFLVLRMLLIFRYNVLSYTNIFFTSKNTLVILLQVYRLTVLYCERLNKKKTPGRKKADDGVIQCEEGGSIVETATKTDANSSRTRIKTENDETALRQEKQIRRHDKESNSCFCFMDQYQVDYWGKDRGYSEEDEAEDEKRIAIDNEDLSEELSSVSDMFEMVSFSSFKDPKMWENVPYSPPAETCSLDRSRARQSEKKRQIDRRNEGAALVRPDKFQCKHRNRRECNGLADLQEIIKSNVEYNSTSKMPPLSQYPHQKNISWEISDKKNIKTYKGEGEAKKKKAGRFTKTGTESREIEQQFEPTRQFNKNDEPSIKSLRKDPDSKRPKLFQVVLDARMQGERREKEMANDLQPNLEKMATAKMATDIMARKCPTCAISKNKRQNGQKRKRSPDEVVICRIKEDTEKELI